MTTAYPLRDKRRRENQARLIRTAHELFIDKGFNRTTMADIAVASGLHIQTIYRHFKTKQALLVAIDNTRFLEEFEARTTDTIGFWRDFAERGALRLHEPRRARFMLNKIRLRDSDAKLAGAHAQHLLEIQKVLMRGIAQDLGLDPVADRLPVLIAAMLIGGNQHALRVWAAADGGTDIVAEVLAMIDAVMPVVRQLESARAAPAAALGTGSAAGARRTRPRGARGA
jgi:AcrR family transcriptional regulator